jgi:hypothetical protein
VHHDSFPEKILQDLGETATLENKFGTVTAQRVDFLGLPEKGATYHRTITYHLTIRGDGCKYLRYSLVVCRDE